MSRVSKNSNVGLPAADKPTEQFLICFIIGSDSRTIAVARESVARSLEKKLGHVSLYPDSRCT
jgi:hypothetical protein